MLFFKKKFLLPILQGTKTQTIRLWRYRRLRPGQRSYIPGAGYISVDSVDPIALEELSDADAAPDGFASAESLRAELLSLYPTEIAAGYQAYRVRFTLLPKKEQRRITAERKREKEIERQKSDAPSKAADAEKRFQETMGKIEALVKGKN